MKLSDILQQNTVPTTHLENALHRALHFRYMLSLIRSSESHEEAVNIAKETLANEPNDQTTKYCDMLVTMGLSIPMSKEEMIVRDIDEAMMKKGLDMDKLMEK